MNESIAPIVVKGTFDLSPLQRSLDAWWKRFGWDVHGHPASLQAGTSDPVQLVKDVLDNGGEPVIAVFILRPSDWNLPSSQDNGADDPPDLSPSETQVATRSFINELLAHCKQTAHRAIVLLAPPQDDVPSEIVEASHHIENQLIAELASHDQIHISRTPQWMGANGAGHDSQIPLYPSLAMSIARHVYQIDTIAPELLVIHDQDLLWQEGAANKEDINVSAAHREFQKVIVGKVEAGTSVAVISAQNEGILRQKFRQHPDMLLTEEDIAGWVGDVDSISTALEALAEKQQVALDRMALLSPDADAISQLRSERPGVLSIALPLTERSPFLQHLWVLDQGLFRDAPRGEEEAASSSVESEGITNDRRDLRNQSETFEDYIKALHVVVEQIPPTAEHYARMAQLTQETSLFNATSRKFSQEEIQSWLGRPYHYSTLFRVRDSFGDYGIAGLIMFERVKRTVLVHNFLLSHPAVGIGVEAKMLSELSRIAGEHNVVDIDLPFFQTERNEPMATFLQQTLEPYCQDLPEEGWLVFQIPLEAAQSVADKTPVELLPLVARTEGDCPPPPSALIQDIATDWNTIALEGYEAPPEREEAPGLVSLRRQTPKLSPFTIVDPNPKSKEAAIPAPVSDEVPADDEPIAPFADDDGDDDTAESCPTEEEKAELAEAEAEAEAEAALPTKTARSVPEPALLVISAASTEELVSERNALAKQLSQTPKADLTEVASHMATSKHALTFRTAHTVSQVGEALEALQSPCEHREAGNRPSLAFLFPDSWSAGDTLGQGLYENHDVFRGVIDWCSEIHQKLTGHHLRETLFNSSLRQSPYRDAAMFAAEWAMAKLWMSWGVRPRACFGQGTGEYAAAVLCGVFSPEEGLALVAKRAELIQSHCPEGRVLKIEEEARLIEPLLTAGVTAIAAHQSPHATLVSGPTDDIVDLQNTLTGRSIDWRVIDTGAPRQSPHMNRMEEDFRRVVEHVDLQPSQLPLFSSITGQPLAPDEACDPNYWAAHLSRPQSTESALTQLAEQHPGLALEIGPGGELADALYQIALEQIEPFPGTPSGIKREVASTMATLGRLWERGCDIDWASFYDLDPDAVSETVPQPEAPEAGIAEEPPTERLTLPLPAAESPQPPQPSAGMCAAQQLLLDQTISETPENDVDPSVTHTPDQPPESPLQEPPIAALDEQRQQTPEPTPTPQSAKVDLQSYLANCLERRANSSLKSQELQQRWDSVTGSSIAADRPRLLDDRRHLGAVWDADDNRFVDVSSAVLPHWLGYRAPELQKAYDRHLRSDPPQSIVSLGIAIGEVLQELAWAERVVLTESSSSAFAASIELAIRHTGRPGIATLQKPGPDSDTEDFISFAADTPDLTAAIRSHQNSLAAIVIDPLQLIGLDRAGRQSILADLRAVATESGMAVILDERTTGFRWGVEDGLDLETLQPDLVIYGESLSDGLPLGLLAGKHQWLDTGDDPLGTSSPVKLGNPLPLVAALATLEAIRNASAASLEAWRGRSQILVDAFRASIAELEAAITIERLGAIFAIQVSGHPDLEWLFEAESINQGVRLSAGQVNAITRSHSDADLEAIPGAFHQAVEALQEYGFLFSSPEAYRARVMTKEDQKLLSYWNDILTERNLLWPSSPTDNRHASGQFSTASLGMPDTGHEPSSRARNNADLVAAAYHTLFQSWSNSTQPPLFLSEIEGQSMPLCLEDGEERTLHQLVETARLSREDASEHRLHHPETFAEWLHRLGPVSSLGLNEPPPNAVLRWQVGPAQITCQYDTGLYTAEEIHSWMECFAVLLEAFATQPAETPVTRLPLISQDRYEQFVVKYNAPADETLSEEPLHRLFESMASSWPNRIAVRRGGEKTSYGELNARADQLAQALHNQGVQCGDTVAVLATPSSQMIESWLAVLKLGAAYLPLDPNQVAKPSVLSRTGARFLLTDNSKGSAATAWAGTDVQVFELDELASGSIDETQPRKELEPATREMPAVVLFHWDLDQPTPVRLSQRGLVSLAGNHTDLDLNAHEVFLLSDSATSDRCLLQVWGPLLNGGVVAIPQDKPTPANLAGTIGTLRVSSLVLGGDELTSLMKNHADEMSWIRQILLLGDLPSRQAVKAILENLPTNLTLAYGPLENSLMSACHKLNLDDLDSTGIPLGSPASRSQIYLLNEAHMPVPVGMTGEVWVGGEGLALFEDDANPAEVIESPFPSSPGKLFRTGDHAQWRPDGSLVLMADRHFSKDPVSETHPFRDAVREAAKVEKTPA